MTVCCGKSFKVELLHCLRKGSWHYLSPFDVSSETGLESALLGLSVNDKESLASIAAALPPVPAHSPGKGTLGQPSVASTSQAKTCAHDRAAVPS